MFDDEMVMRQLRYTGMLETVRIRQAGFNVRLPYEEFIHHYRILLPKALLRYVRGHRLTQNLYFSGLQYYLPHCLGHNVYML